MLPKVYVITVEVGEYSGKEFFAAFAFLDPEAAGRKMAELESVRPKYENEFQDGGSDRWRRHSDIAKRSRAELVALGVPDHGDLSFESVFCLETLELIG
jgi:hypothetical protein